MIGKLCLCVRMCERGGGVLRSELSETSNIQQKQLSVCTALFTFVDDFIISGL